MAIVYTQNPGGFVQTGNPGTVNDAQASTFAIGQLGSLVVSNDDITSTGATIPAGAVPRVWQYVTLDSAMSATVAACQVVYWKDLTNFVVTADVTASDHFNLPAGILVNGSASKGNNVYILVKGVTPILATAATPAAMGKVIPDATNDGQAATVAQGTASTDPQLGIWLAAKNTAYGASSFFPAPGANYALALLDIRVPGSF